MQKILLYLFSQYKSIRYSSPKTKQTTQNGGMNLLFLAKKIRNISHNVFVNFSEL